MFEVLRTSVCLALLLTLAGAEASPTVNAVTPTAVTRNNASNFRDMVFAVCVSRIYRDIPKASADAASTARALVDWTFYDAEASPDKIDALVAQYLKKNYANPIGDDRGEHTQFGLLKCLDLYHSKELAALSRKVVLHPGTARRE